ncbi:MAG: family 43 glycosylhydrolase [Dehalococcoidia bacterium]|nr:family 43 glycosylhydrolase [Dehalococcoidia bacterium]
MRSERARNGNPGPRRIGRRSFLLWCAAAAPALALAGARPRVAAVPSLVPEAQAAKPQAIKPQVERVHRASLERRVLATPRVIVMPEEDPAMVVEARTLALQNPVIEENCPDPHVLSANGTFYMVSTSHNLPAFPIRWSADLARWGQTGAFVFTHANRPAWAQDSHFWAPELHRVGGRYIAYFTARSKSSDRLCIGAAVADGPLGPYRDIGQPLISADVHVLDATFFRDDDGRQYLYWKSDAANGTPSGPLYAQRLTRDGLGLVGDRYALALNDLPWEGPLIEGPSVVKRGEFYHLFYSGGKYNTADYAVGVARSTSPVAGFVKRGDPILRGNTWWRGPGHNSVLRHRDQDYLVYHAWSGDQFRGVRSCLIDPIAWSDDGWPVINDGTPGQSAALT